PYCDVDNIESSGQRSRRLVESVLALLQVRAVEDAVVQPAAHAHARVPFAAGAGRPVADESSVPGCSGAGEPAPGSPGAGSAGAGSAEARWALRRLSAASGPVAKPTRGATSVASSSRLRRVSSWPALIEWTWKDTSVTRGREASAASDSATCSGVPTWVSVTA